MPGAHAREKEDMRVEAPGERGTEGWGRTNGHPSDSDSVGISMSYFHKSVLPKCWSRFKSGFLHT